VSTASSYRRLNPETRSPCGAANCVSSRTYHIEAGEGVVMKFDGCVRTGGGKLDQCRTAISKGPWSAGGAGRVVHGGFAFNPGVEGLGGPGEPHARDCRAPQPGRGPRTLPVVHRQSEIPVQVDGRYDGRRGSDRHKAWSN